MPNPIDLTGLAQVSADSRRRAYRGTSHGIRNHEAEKIAKRAMSLIQAAVSMAAGGRVRRGRYVPDADRDEALGALLEAMADGTLTPNLQDADRPTMPTADGELRLRPHADLVSAAGAALDTLRHEHEAKLPEGLAAQSAALRSEAGPDKRSCLNQLVDPHADPMPPECADAADAAGIWPNDYLRAAIAAETTDLPMTAGDWQVTSYGAGKTMAALGKGLERAGKVVEVAKESDSPQLEAFAADLRKRITPTPEESAEHERAALAALQTSDGFDARARTPRHGVRPAATMGAWRLLMAVRADHGRRNARRARRAQRGTPRHWRDSQPHANPERTRDELPAAASLTPTPPMPEGWRHERRAPAGQTPTPNPTGPLPLTDWQEANLEAIASDATFPTTRPHEQSAQERDAERTRNAGIIAAIERGRKIRAGH